MLQRIRDLGAPGLWMAIVLPALLLVQGVWLYMTFTLERKRFDSAAREALYSTVETLQMNEAQRLLQCQPQIHTAFEEVERAEINAVVGDSSVGQIDQVVKIDVQTATQSDRRPDNLQTDPAPNNVEIDKNNPAFILKALQNQRFNALDIERVAEIQTIREVVLRMLNNRRPLETRLQEAKIDLVLGEQIAQNGLKDKDTPFAYAVVNDSGKVLLQTANFERNVEAMYSVRLFSYGVNGGWAELQLAFPEKELGYNWRHVLIMQLSTGLIAIVIWAFLATAQSIREQRELSARKTVFINNLSHELKTPITTIGLASEGLRNQLPPDSAYLRIIKAETDRMYRQIERVLQTAELNQRDLLSEAELLDLQAFLTDRVASFGPRANTQQTQLALSLAKGLPEIVTDKLLLTTAIDNLIDNALKYGGEGGSIQVAANQHGERVRIAVSDTGPGIAKPQLKQIFEPYYRPQQDRHDVKGFGLGLSQVREIVRLMGGEIQVESTIGQGSTFEIYLPIDFDLPQSN